jgi:hypothetical protein
MIELAHPQKKPSKLVALAITTTILIVSYIIMAQWAVKTPYHKMEIYEKLEWFKFTPLPKPKPISAPEENRTEEAEKPKAESTPTTPMPEKIELDIAKLKDVLKVDLTPKTPISAPTKTPSANPAMQKIKLDELLPELSQSPTLKGEGPSLPIPGMGKSNNKTGGNIQIKIADAGIDASAGKLASIGKTGRLLTGLKGKNAGLPGKEISLIDISKLGKNYSDFSPIFKALVEWIKKHPKPHPPAIMSLTRQSEREKDALRSVVQFHSGNRSFTLFLKVIESLYEVHIVLVEGNRLTYLIDSGFKKRSHYLRVGTATYADSSMTKLVACNTSQEKLSDQRTKEFYQIFLSWWNSVKEEVKHES